MINRRFLNFKTYEAFKRKLDLNEIDKENAIVFIQDRLCIWARDKEYICDGPYTANTEGDSLKFKNGNNTVIFSINVGEDTITFRDGDGNETSITLTTKSETEALEQIINNIRYQLEDVLQSLLNKLDKLIAGYGIDISPKNVISYTLDDSLYIIVDLLPDLSKANSNKIYILEIENDGQYTHEEWRVINGEWVPIGVSIPTVDYSSYINQILNNYARIQFVQDNFLPKGNYALLDYVNETFVKRSEVYNPKLGTWGTDDTNGESSVNIGESSNSNITIDTSLSYTSSNPVANWVLMRALNEKANSSDLDKYATRVDLSRKADLSALNSFPTFADLENKQNILTAGRGIAIENNVISSTIDSSVYLIVSELPTQDIDPNKIYILDTVENGEHVYTQYNYRGGWVMIGSVTPEVDLTDYLTSNVASNTYLSKQDAIRLYQPVGNYQPAGNYADVNDVADAYQPKGQYIDQSTFDAFIINVNNTFLRRGGYALASDVSSAFTLLLQIIDLKYVLKKDVYIPVNNEWSSNDAVLINIGTSNGDGSSEQGEHSGGSSSNMVTLTVDQYAGLVRANLVDENTYYFTYEESSLKEWHFGGTFPITLTDGSTPDNIGTFPINLT